MEHFSRLPPIDISCYQWVCSEKDTNLWQRQALAGENTWVLKPKERREMFLGGHISLSVPTTLDDIRRAAEEVWRRLRFEHPEISLASSCDDGGKCLIEHRTPRDDDEVRAWAKRTVIVKASLQRVSFSDARSAISQRKPGKGDPAFVYLYVQACTTNPRTTSIGFTFHVDHLCADGIGIRILAHCFFRLLAAELSAVRDQVREEINWQRIAENLPPPWTSLMNDNQRTNGAAFDDAANNFGLKIPPADGPGTHMSLFRDFSKEESTAVLRAVKEKLGTSYTVTHLGHAAMVLAMLKFNPPPDNVLEGQSFISPCFMNGRRYLRADPSMTHDYIPVCQAFGAVVFPNVKDYIISSDATNERSAETLIKATKAARTSYQSIREQDSILSESLPIPEYLAGDVFKNPPKRRESADPYFLSDGIVEQYIDRIYHDRTGLQEILSVEDIRFAANADGPSLIIRMCSWRGSIYLSGEWNDAQYSKEDVQLFLDDIAFSMLSLGTNV